MVTEAKCCKKCQSENIVKNGRNSVRNPEYKCKDCGFGGVFQSLLSSEETKEALLQVAQKRPGAHGLARIFGVSHQTALNWIKKAESLPDVTETLVPYEDGETLELDDIKYRYSKRVCSTMPIRFLLGWRLR